MIDPVFAKYPPASCRRRRCTATYPKRAIFPSRTADFGRDGPRWRNKAFWASPRGAPRPRLGPMKPRATAPQPLFDWLSSRSAGVLLHPTSLPGDQGIGTLDGAAVRFLDFLKAAGMSWWQVCPLGPTGYGDSPYQCFSAFAGNPYLIDLRDLAARGLLKPAEIAPAGGRGERGGRLRRPLPAEVAAPSPRLRSPQAGGPPRPRPRGIRGVQGGAGVLARALRLVPRAQGPFRGHRLVGLAGRRALGKRDPEAAPPRRAP